MTIGGDCHPAARYLRSSAGTDSHRTSALVLVPLTSSTEIAVGEAGTVGALPVLMSAVLDALRPLGVDWLDMPATPQRVWRAIREARSAV